MIDLAPHSSRGHAKLSPSAAHRWIACPGSVAACEGIPKTSSSFADEGTAAHTICEFCLAERLDADAFLGDWIDIVKGTIYAKDVNRGPSGKWFEITDEMVEAVQVYLDFVRPLYEGAEVEIEAKLDLRSIPGMEFGTGDFCAYQPVQKAIVVKWGAEAPVEVEGGGVLTIADFKYGKGVPVEVRDNPQLLAYALGVARRYHNRGIKKIRLAVVQPRCPHRDGPVRVEEYDALDLLDFEETLTVAALATTAPDAPRVAGEHCKFCPAAPGCKEFAGAAFAVAADVFSETAIAEPTQLDSFALGKALRNVYLLKGWLKRMEEYAHAEAMAGRIPDGHKLVAKRATRRWRNEGDAETFLRVSFKLSRDQVIEESLISPATADKLLKKRKGEIEPYVERVSSGTNLVPIEDPREPARPEAGAVFAAFAE